MPDVWATVAELDSATQDRLADVLETRGADPQQQELRTAFLEELRSLPQDSRLLDVGCGTGVLTRALARLPGIGSVVGVDVAPSLLNRARDLAADAANVTFLEGDARSLPVEDRSFDAVVFDSTFSHVSGTEHVVSEAARVLRPGGLLAVFDGDYATATVALGDDDPLQACVDAMMRTSVTERRVMRRLPTLLRAAGFEQVRTRSHGYLDTDGGPYMLSVVDRGADVLAASGEIGTESAEALKAEARRRAAAGAFFGHIAYVALTAVQPGTD
jgi:ubiquinone/menaquinone biosynthesis C-methylase UbiE